jgi:predicted enzyme related to lactoylglutathione lyase
MKATHLEPLVITQDLAAVRTFYTEVLGYSLSHDMDTYVRVRFGESPDAPGLAFMCPSPQGPDHGVFDGRGLIVSIPTDDADAHHARVEKSDARVMSEPSDKPWGWRSYAVVDPAGVILDFFHVIAKPASVDATG